MTTDTLTHETLTERTATDSIRIERLMPGAIDEVWAYLVESDKRAKWFASGPLEQHAGGAITLTWRNSDLSDGMPNPNGAGPDGVDHVMHGTVVACEPPHRLTYNWAADGTGSETTFELTAEGDETRLVLTHVRLPTHKQLVNVSGGWHVHIGILSDLLAGRTPRLFWQEHARLGKVYAERFPD